MLCYINGYVKLSIKDHATMNQAIDSNICFYWNVNTCFFNEKRENSIKTEYFLSESDNSV